MLINFPSPTELWEDILLEKWEENIINWFWGGKFIVVAKPNLISKSDFLILLSILHILQMEKKVYF